MVPQVRNHGRIESRSESRDSLSYKEEIENTMSFCRLHHLSFLGIRLSVLWIRGKGLTPPLSLRLSLSDVTSFECSVPVRIFPGVTGRLVWGYKVSFSVTSEDLPYPERIPVRSQVVVNRSGKFYFSQSPHHPFGSYCILPDLFFRTTPDIMVVRDPSRWLPCV